MAPVLPTPIADYVEANAQLDFELAADDVKTLDQLSNSVD
jgi:hypothetical protein